MKYKKTIIGVASIFTFCVIAVVLTQPLFIKAIAAKYKSTDHFLTLQDDARIRYEQPAKRNAVILSDVLSESQNAVENILSARFQKPVEVYVCSTQEVFNEYVFLSKNVRGAMYWGKVFLSPGAFNRGSLKRLTSHELTHYLFYTYLGRDAHIKGIPLWFREGVAEFVANGGSEYHSGKELSSLMSYKEKSAYLSGDLDFWFSTENPADAVTKEGVANWLLYRVGSLFVHFMRNSKPDKFNALIQLLLSGTEFDEALHVTYGQDTESLLTEFTHYLTLK